MSKRKRGVSYVVVFLLFFMYWLQMHVVVKWAIPENIHTKPRTASMFYPPLAFGNSKMRYPPMPSEFHNREPPLPFRISVFLEVHFRLSNAYMNKRT